MRHLLLGLVLVLLVGQADAAYVLKNHVTCSGAGGCTTSPNADFTGVDLIVTCISNYNGGAGSITSTPSDSSSNSYTAAEDLDNNNGSLHFKMSYKQAPSVSAAMNFSASATGGNSFAALMVAGFSGSAASPLDQSPTPASSGASLVQSLATGSMTPGAANELVISCLAAAAVDGSHPLGIGVDGSNTLTDSQNGNNATNEAGGMSYWIQTSATADNATWSWTGGAQSIAGIASFKASGGVAAKKTLPSLILQGVGAN